jgi:MtN3 and saliva related transmembrane protein
MTAALVGYAAAVMSVSAFVPQAWRIVKTRDTTSLSTPMWILQVCAFATWTAFGVLLGEWPIVVPNAICCVLSAFILIMKVAPRPVREHIAEVLDPSAHSHSP